MINMRYMVLIAALVWLVGCDTPDIVPSDERPVVVSMLLTEQVPRGDSFVLEWRFRLAEGWHLYWDGLNDSGAPPRIDLDLPEGWSAGPLFWPAPERLVSPGGILDHVYHDELMLVQDIYYSGDPAADFSASLEWIACRERCVFGDTVLTSGDAGPPVTGFPIMTQAGDTFINPSWEGNTLTLSPTDAQGLEFMPASDCGPLVDALADTKRDGPRLDLRFRSHEGRFGPARGILRVWRKDRWWPIVLIDVPAIPAGNPIPGGE